MRISIALCTFNGQSYINEQLESIARQTLLPDEIIICDDKSTDNTLAIVRDFASRSHIFFRIYKNEFNFGYKSNFKRALKLCNGDIIAFCDQDDIWAEKKLQQCVEVLSNPDIELVIHQAEICDANGRKTGRYVYSADQEFGSNLIEAGPWPSALGFTQVFKSKLLNDKGMSDVVDHWTGGEIAHDQFVLLTALARSNVRYISTPLALYRHHQSNVIGAHHKTMKSRINYLLKNRSLDYRNFYRAARTRSIAIRSAEAQAINYKSEFDISLSREYKKLSGYYLLRHFLYAEKRLSRRFALFMSSIKVRRSLAKTWRLSSRALVRDFLLGVLISSYLREN